MLGHGLLAVNFGANANHLTMISVFFSSVSHHGVWVPKSRAKLR
jgi:hypothetical protein